MNNSFFRLLRDNIHAGIILKIISVMLVFSLCRVLFYFFYIDYFSNIVLSDFFNIIIAGLRYDLSAVCVLNIPYVFFQTVPFNFRFNKYYQKVLNVLFYIFNGAGIIANCIDFAYFKYTLKRTTADIFITQGLGNDVLNLIPAFARDFWYIPLIFILLLFFLVFFNKQFKSSLKKTDKSFIAHFYQVILFFIFLTLFLIGGRGGLQMRPLSIISAGKYSDAKNIPLIINTPFAVISTLGKNAIKPYYFFDEKKLSSLSPVIHYPEKKSKFTSQNVVLIILESFSKEHVGALNKKLQNGEYRGYTPFLDSLIGKSLVFGNAFSNGKKSNEGVPAILAGIPSLMDIPYTSSIYSGNNISGLASLLSEKGYSTAFFHGGNNGTMGFDALAKTTGFDKYYGRNEYPGDDYDGKWGVWDEEYLQYFASMLDKMPQPFFASVFTLSSHHPYKVPARYEGKFPEGPLPIHRTIGYTDYALKLFFEKIKNSRWFNNTIFIITADHTSDSYLPYYMTKLGIYRIPLIIYSKGIIPGVNSNVVQQIDILPTTLDILNYDKPYYSLGNSVFDTINDRFAVNYLNNTFHIIEGKYMLEFNGEKSLNLYNFEKDSLLVDNILNSNPVVAKNMELKIKAFLQVYSKDLRNNSMKFTK